MGDKNTKLPFSKYLTEGIIIASVPVVAYGLKFVYEFGYSRYFDIPPELVSFSLQSIFPTLPIVLFVIGYVIYQIGTVFHYHNIDMKYLQIVYRNVAILVILTGLAYQFAPNTLYSLIFLVPALYLILRHFIMPLLWHRDIKGYMNKTNKHFETLIKQSDTLVDQLFNFGIYQRSAILIMLAGVFVMTAFYGYQIAKNQRQFWVDSTNGNDVVVRFIDERAVFIRVDDNNKLTGEFWVRDLTEHNLTLRKMEVGRIVP